MMLACGQVCKWLSRVLIDVGGSSPLWAIHSLARGLELYKRRNRPEASKDPCVYFLLMVDVVLRAFPLTAPK